VLALLLVTLDQLFDTAHISGTEAVQVTSAQVLDQSFVQLRVFAKPFEQIQNT
jgi:hypothetical protein